MKLVKPAEAAMVIPEMTIMEYCKGRYKFISLTTEQKQLKICKSDLERDKVLQKNNVLDLPIKNIKEYLQRKQFGQYNST